MPLDAAAIRHAVVTAGLEYLPGFRRHKSRIITYDDMDIIRQNDDAALIADLRKRTGLDIDRVAIGTIDLLRDTAQVTVYFPEKRG